MHSDWPRGVFAWGYVNMVVTSKRCFAFQVLISKAQIWKKKFLSWKIDKFTLFTQSLLGWNLDNLYKHAVLSFFFFYLSWHFKQEKFIFWKESFFAKQELITHARLCVPDFTTGIRISLLISDMTKSLAFFLGKVTCNL